MIIKTVLPIPNKVLEDTKIGDIIYITEDYRKGGKHEDASKGKFYICKTDGSSDNGWNGKWGNPHNGMKDTKIARKLNQGKIIVEESGYLVIKE